MQVFSIHFLQFLWKQLCGWALFIALLRSYTSHVNIRDISVGVTFNENENSLDCSALQSLVYTEVPRQTSKYIIKSGKR